MLGRKFGELTVTSKEFKYVHKHGVRYKYWECLCECGRTKWIYESSLTNGFTKKCGNCSGIKDIKVGNVYGKITVVGEKFKYKGRWHYLVKCSCGNPNPVRMRSENILRKDVKGCGECTKFDILGKKFGRWTVLELGEKRGKKNQIYFVCECECGTIKEVRRDYLLQGKTLSCSCYAKEKASKIHFNDLTGKRFGRLLVTGADGQNKQGSYMFKAICDCGNETRLIGSSLVKKYKPTRSCGCLIIEALAEARKKTVWRK